LANIRRTQRVELEPYSEEWNAELARKRAAGERTNFMEERAREGKYWEVERQNA
jgi:hypothetical protein